MERNDAVVCASPFEKVMQEAGLAPYLIQKRRHEESYKIIREFENWMNSVAGCFVSFPVIN